MNGEVGAWPHARGLRILRISYGLGSNNLELISNAEFFEPGEIQSLITNWCEIEHIPYSSDMDAYAHFLDDPERPFAIDASERMLLVTGDLSCLDREGIDRRWSLLGNTGLFFRFALTVQERHGIYSFHASAIYKPADHELMLIVGKAGAGKTVFLLEALVRGYQIFSTEMIYFCLLPDGLNFYRGALMDNIRIGNFVYDFPQAAERLGLEVPEVDDPWGEKVSVDMSSATTEEATLVNPTLSIIFPRIEAGYEHANVQAIKNPRTLTRLLFESASEKIGNSCLLYEQLPLPGLDNPRLAQARRDAISCLVAAPQWKIKQAKTTLAGPKCCMEGLE
jgi:hypothetical protein